MQVVGAIIRNHKNEYLLQLRDNNARSFKNCWTFFGGHVEDGEELEDALIRELSEELSMPAEAIGPIRQVQVNKDDNGVEQYVYEIFTDITIDQLVLGEGAAMEFIAEDLLFSREFAFNIEKVLRDYISTLE
ncbi:MAG: NUDIX domain-containing protein [Candidatus Microsaccharimonas sp.]